MVEKINTARANHGLPPLRTSPDLMAAARAHSGAMSGQGLLFHTASFSSLCCWDHIAENVGMGYSVRDLHRAFMHSAPHRANILDRRMEQVGRRLRLGQRPAVGDGGLPQPGRLTRPRARSGH